MSRFIVSVVVWCIFLALSTLLIYFGINYLTYYTITWNNAFGFSLVVRFLFTLNKIYSDLEKEFGI